MLFRSGLNLALDYLPGSVTFDPLMLKIEPELASRIVWFDAFVTNLDRTPRNTNMLVWHGQLWLIDHGAALYFQHDWRDYIDRAASLPVPEIVLVELDPELARTEPDPEIQDLIRASSNLVDSSLGLNLALDYLPGSVTFDPLSFIPDAELASRIVWFDAFVTNLDRTARNTNMLVWHGKLWLIEIGRAHV